MKKFSLNISFLVRRFQPKKQDHAKAEMHVTRDWQIVLAVFLVLSVFVISFGIHSVRKLYNEDAFSSQDTGQTSVKTISRETLDNVLGTYKAKNDLFQTLLSERPRSVDPSI